jgi:hypothetical protein
LHILGNERKKVKVPLVEIVQEGRKKANQEENRILPFEVQTPEVLMDWNLFARELIFFQPNLILSKSADNVVTLDLAVKGAR